MGHENTIGRKQRNPRIPAVDAGGHFRGGSCQPLLQPAPAEPHGRRFARIRVYGQPHSDGYADRLRAGTAVHHSAG